MAQGGSNKKVTNGLVTASFGAVIAVYSAGYVRTQAASDRFASRIAERHVPASPEGEASVAAPAIESAPEPVPSTEIGKPNAAPVEETSPRNVLNDARLTTASQPVPATAPTSAAPPAAQNLVTEAPPTVETKPDVAVPVETISQAAAQPAAPPTAAPARTGKWKDGTYRGWGYSRHGDLQAEVVIEGGRIASAIISDCQTRYSCSVIDPLIPQVAKRQSPDVDNVSGATQSADAFYGAVVEALSKAK